MHLVAAGVVLCREQLFGLQRVASLKAALLFGFPIFEVINPLAQEEHETSFHRRPPVPDFGASGSTLILVEHLARFGKGSLSEISADSDFLAEKKPDMGQ
ncbi:MAG: hypothetical protein ACOYMS_04925 [Terrimicrobiaceae bacterium]